MHAGTVPFHADSIMALYETIRTALVSFPAKPATSPELQDLILQLLQKDPAKRATMQQVMTHPWVSCNGAQPLQSLQVWYSVVLMAKYMLQAVTAAHLWSAAAVPSMYNLQAMSTACGARIVTELCMQCQPGHFG